MMKQRIHLRQLLIATATIFMTLAAGCRTFRLRGCDKLIPGEIVEALGKNDKSAISLAAVVLDDSASKTYCYDITVRDNAFDLIKNIKSPALRPLLIKVAAMDYSSQPDFRQTWDLASIQRALIALTEARDKSAADFNIRRLDSDVWLQRVAVDNLRRLEFWGATTQVVDLLNKTEPTPEHRLLLSGVLRFLGESPGTTLAVCPRIKALTLSFADCFTKPSAAWQCGDFVPSVHALNERLRCGMVNAAVPEIH